MRVDDPRPPLPEWILDVYEIVLTHINERDEYSAEERDQIASITYEQATEILCASDDLVLEPEDVDHALKRLLNRGYFYEVNDELRVTGSV